MKRTAPQRQRPARSSEGASVIGAGYRRSNGLYEYQNAFGYFWTSTYGEQSKAWCRVLDHDAPTISRFILDRLYGASVRCIADISTGLPDGEEDEGLQLFPNPASDHVRIQGTFSSGAHLALYDAQGRVVHVQALASSPEVDIAQLPQGVFVVELTDGPRTLRQVLVKQ